MKKRLLCVLSCLVLLLALALPLTACDGPEQTPDSDRYLEGKEYAEHLYEGIYSKNYANMPHDALITSVSELDALREQVQLEESVFAFDDDGNPVSIETVYTQIEAQLDSYSAEYFKDNVLVVIFRGASSGSHWYAVKDVVVEENTVNVTIQYWETAMGTADFQEWCILVECPKGDFSGLNVVTETKEQQPRVSGTAFYIIFTHEATIDTIFQDYTEESFSELDFDFTIEEYFAISRDRIRAAMSSGEISAELQEYLQRYSRMFYVTLAEKSEQNVLRAVELLSQRAEIKVVDPVFEYYFEMD